MINTFLIAAMLAAAPAPSIEAQEGLKAYRVTFSRIGDRFGVQRVIIFARTQNDARNLAETVYHSKPTAIALIKKAK